MPFSRDHFSRKPIQRRRQSPTQDLLVNSDPIGNSNPIAMNDSDRVYEKMSSFIHLPIEITVKDLENRANNYLNRSIIATGTLPNQANKHLLQGVITQLNIPILGLTKIMKQGPLEMTEKEGRLEIILPIKLLAPKSSFEGLSGKVKLTCHFTFQNWKMEIFTDIVGIDWSESPNVSFWGKKIPISGVLNSIIYVLSVWLGNKFDEIISQSLDIKSLVVHALKQVFNPIKIQKTYHIWLAMQPVELISSKPLIISNGKILFYVGAKAYVETFINTPPPLQFNGNQIKFTSLTNPTPPINDEFNVNLAVIITYSEASRLIKEKLAQRGNLPFKTFTKAKEYIMAFGNWIPIAKAVKNKVVDDLFSIATITDVHLKKGTNKNLILDLKLAGAIHSFQLFCTPKYNTQTKEIYLDQLDFTIDSERRLLAFVGKIFHQQIITMIQQSSVFPISDQLTQAHKQANTNWLKNYPVIPGITLSGELTTLQPNKLVLNPEAIIGMVTAKGQVAVKIDGLN